MRRIIDNLRGRPRASKSSSLAITACALAAIATLSVTALSQTPPPSPPPPPDPSAAQTPATPQATPVVPPSQPAASDPAPAVQTNPHPRPEKDPTLSQGAFSVHTVGGEIKEDQLKQALVGKTMYLRDGYQDNSLEFDEQGRLLGHSQKGSYTLSQIQINKVKLSKHKLELDGDRYALHFLGAAPYEDPTKATDRVKITPKKKMVRISFEREEVEKAKTKDKHEGKKNKHHDKPEATETASTSGATATPDASNASTAKSEMKEQPSGKKVTTTNSAVRASQLLLTALDNVFSRGIDERMIASMPDFWKLYYQAAEAKTDYKPTDPGVLRQSAVDGKAKLISAIDPPSNEFAQANGVAGIALYHAVIGSDGKVAEIIAGRPIGFGLDESAEQTIRKATFQPATKDGKPVPVTLDVVVSFRIYSKRTSQPSAQTTTGKPDEPVLPGPYTVQTRATVQPPPAQ